MTFDEILEQVIALLKQQGRVSYGAVRRRYNLDEAYLKDLTDEIIKAQRLATDEDGSVMVWAGDAGVESPKPGSQTDQSTPATQEEPPTQINSQPVESHQPSPERRQLTVMFCDLVGSTELSGQLDPEDYREVVQAYQKVCTEVIQRYDGHIAQYLGDGLLVYFGYPQSHEDEAQRAVYTGLGILDAMRQLNEHLESETNFRLALRIGIHTGLVVVGDIGEGARREQLALGETPNIAARIQGLAEPDTVVISEVTYQLIQGYFEYQNLGKQRLKGVTEPVNVYRMIRESTHSRLGHATARGLTPLIGREQEFHFLLDRWRQVKNGDGQVVLLSGEGGTGKARLVQVVQTQVENEPHIRLECRSFPYYQNTTLYPITDLLQRILQFQPDDTPADKLEKLEQALIQYHVPLGSSVCLLADFLSLPMPQNLHTPLYLSPRQQRQKTLEGLVTLLLKMSEQEPLLFILVDLHWADPTTLELLDRLIDQISKTSILMLLTCRPTFKPSWNSHAHFTEMPLNRLSDPQAEQLIEHLSHAQPLPRELRQQIVERSDGIPLFIEEMTKAVLASDILQESDDQYVLAGTLTSLAIPNTLQDSLMARLDRLVSAKGIAQLGATIGRQFSYEVLRAVSQLDDETLQRELHRLVHADLLDQQDVPPQAHYLFRQALIAEAAYQSLLKSTRQQYHQRIANVLGTQFSEIAERQPELVAHHYTSGGLYEQAVVYWEQAGQQAIAHSAYVEAIHHLNQGLALITALPETEKRIRQELLLLTALGSALIAMHGYTATDVEATYARALPLCQRVGDVRQQFEIVRGLYMCAVVGAQLPRAHNLAKQLLQLVQSSSHPDLLVLAHYTRGQNLFLLGQITPALESLAKGVRCVPHPHHSVVLVDTDVSARSYTAWALWLRGCADQSSQQNEEALRGAETLSNPFLMAFALIYASSFYQRCRETQRMQKAVERAIAIASEQGFTHWLSQGRILRGWIVAMRGQTEMGLAQMQHGLDHLQVIGAHVLLPYFLSLVADVYYRMGQPECGLQVVSEALTHSHRTRERWWEAELYRLKGNLLLQLSQDNPTEAETCFHQSLDIARDQDAKVLELRTSTHLARLCQSQGKTVEARELLEPVYNWFTEGFDTADLIDAKTLLDELERSR